MEASNIDRCAQVCKMGLKAGLTIRSPMTWEGWKRERGEKMGGLRERKLQKLVAQKRRGELLK